MDRRSFRDQLAFSIRGSRGPGVVTCCVEFSRSAHPRCAPPACREGGRSPSRWISGGAWAASLSAGRDNRFHVHVNRTALKKVCDPRPRLIGFNQNGLGDEPGPIWVRRHTQTLEHPRTKRAAGSVELERRPREPA
jgi:hypothetical protein